MKILFQGDSVTEMARNRSNPHHLGRGYPKFAADLIRSRHPDVDFEFIDPEERFEYINFLQELRGRLNPMGKPLFSALAPKTSDTQRGILYEGHDYPGISAAVNFILLMTYEWGYTFGPPYVIYSTTNYIGYLREKMLVLRGVADIAASFCFDWVL